MMWKMVTLLVGLSALAQINEQCVITAGGKPVHVTADGFYDLRAVPAGAPVRLYARCTDASGVVRYGRTEFLQPEAGQLLENLAFSFSASPFPRASALIVAADRTAYTIGKDDPGQLSVTATHASAADLDVADGVGVTYTSSNPAVVSVSATGLIEAIAEGNAVIGVAYDGLRGAITVAVNESGNQATTVEGLVRFADGSPVLGAEVSAGGESGTTDASGQFSFQPLLLESGPLRIAAVKRTDVQYFATSAVIDAVLGGITDGGLLVLSTPRQVDTDGDGILDDYELTLSLPKPPFQFDLNNPDTDGNGILDGAEDDDEDGLPDFYELLIGTSMIQRDSDHPDNSISDGDEDFDSDGLTNLQEFENNSNPYLPDTDGDGVTDLDEVNAGFDPADATSHPKRVGYGRAVSFRRTN